MPKIYAEYHDKFINNYFETSQDKVIGMDRIVYAQNKQGYLIPCTLLIKILPNLDEGILFVSFMKDLKVANKNLKSQNMFINKSKNIECTDEEDEKVRIRIKFSKNDRLITSYLTEKLGLFSESHQAATGRSGFRPRWPTGTLNTPMNSPWTPLFQS